MHIPENKRTKEMISVLLERIKSPKIILFDYADEYTREWFYKIYHLNRSLKLNKLNISGEMTVQFLRKVSESY